MINSYFRIAIRNLLLSKVFSFINIFGLSIGIACALMIVLFVRDELSFDQFHEKRDSIFRIGVEMHAENGSLEFGMGSSSIVIGPALKVNLPEVNQYVRLNHRYEDLKVGDRVLSQSVMAVDTNFFSVFSFRLLTGDSKTALSHPNSIVLTTETSKNLFGSEDSIGQTLLINRDGKMELFIVTAIAQRCPDNSTIQFQALIPLIVSPELQNDRWAWVNFNVNTFLVINNGTNIPSLEARMKAVYEEESREAMQRVRGFGFKGEFVNKLQSLNDIHLSTLFKAEGHGAAKGSDPEFSWLLSAIAVFILLIACINFVNLSIARSFRRAKEIGIRKIVGSGRQQLVRQFFGESILYCAIAFCVGLLLTWLVLPLFNELTNKELSVIYLLDPVLILASLLLFFVTGIAAGLYPALVVSKYDPVHILYQRFRRSGKNYLQRGLIVFQFSLASLLIVATIVVQRQFTHLTTLDLGFDYHDVVVITKKNLSLQQVNQYREALSQSPDIESVSANGATGTDAKINGDATIFFFFDAIDSHYFATYRIPIIAGRNFSDLPSDSANAIIVNEALVKSAGWNDPIGQEIHLFPFEEKKRQVIGVVRDYHSVDLNQAIGPQAFVSAPIPGKVDYNAMYIRIKPGTEASSQALLESAFKKLFQISPFELAFREEEIINRYKSEARWQQTMMLAAIVTICISCFGLFGLSLLIAEKKFKEISIRKVLGASVLSIVRGLSASYLTLVLMALAVSMPAAYYLSGLFLERYPFRIALSPWIFASTGALTILLALVTISFQSIRAASTNPTNGLRSE